jgi:hypothetical protein
MAKDDKKSSTSGGEKKAGFYSSFANWEYTPAMQAQDAAWAAAEAVREERLTRVGPIKPPSADGWILLYDAYNRTAEAYQAPGIARQSLRRWLEAGLIRWRCLGFEGLKRPGDPDLGEKEFWCEFNPAADPRQPRQVILRIGWAESWARRGGMHGYSAVRVEVPLSDLTKMLPVVSTMIETPASPPLPAPAATSPASSPSPETPEEDGWRVRQIRADFPEIFPGGRPLPDHLSTEDRKVLQHKIHKAKGNKPGDRESIRRAVGLRKDPPKRK